LLQKKERKRKNSFTSQALTICQGFFIPQGVLKNDFLFAKNKEKWDNFSINILIK